MLPRSLEIFTELEKNKPDVVHIYWGHYPSIVGYLVKRYMPDLPLTISLVAYDLEMGYGGTKWLVHHADKIRTLADVNVGRIRDIYSAPEDKIEVIYDCVDIARLEPHLLEQIIPKRLISVGRLVSGKGMADVIEVFSTVIKHHPDASLVILGDGPERDNLEKMCNAAEIAQDVTFAGHVNHDTVLKEMAKADIFIFMSKNRAERLPNVVKEAMFAECICIASDTIGIRELIPDEDHGFVVGMGDIDCAKELVLTVLDTNFERQEVQHLAKGLIASKFNLEISAKQYLSMWQQVVEARSAVNILELSSHSQVI